MIAKEAILWNYLEHPNITPLLGLYFIDDARNRISLVSPWMEKGDLVEFLKKNPTAPRIHIVRLLADSFELNY
jgi:serine/threonine protein kinase